MLVLTRRLGEEIIINSVIVVKVLEIKGSQVRIGIEAPTSITVYRKEVLDGSRQNYQNDFRKNRS